MERQTKHRILGMLVVTGLVIILLPLFEHNKDSSTEVTTLITSPPFPDQPVQTSAEDATLDSANSPQTPGAKHKQESDEIIKAIHNNAAENTQTPDRSTLALIDKVDNDSVQIRVPYNEIVESEMSANKLKTSESQVTTNTDKMKKSAYRIIEGDKATSILMKTQPSSLRKENPSTPVSVKTPIKTSFKSSPKPSIDDDLIQVKSAVWVIQIGSFENKENALRIVNQLRANGYHAFIQHISTAFGENTRVFVGPLSKHASARELANRLQSEMNIEGIVISYKPLTL